MVAFDDKCCDEEMRLLWLSCRAGGRVDELLSAKVQVVLTDEVATFKG